MNVYVGQTRAAGWIRTLESYGWGEMCVREEVPPRRTPWAFDNGAFKDWTSEKPFDETRYLRALDALHLVCNTRPDFIVVPDLVAQGTKSLDFSLSWLPRIRKAGAKAPLYLVLQNGMDEQLLDDFGCLHEFAGLFVGGTLDWKLKTAPGWVGFAHARGLKLHVGRMGTTNRVRAAIRWGVDSIDSCLPLWSEGNLERFKRGFTPAQSRELFGDEPSNAAPTGRSRP